MAPGPAPAAIAADHPVLAAERRRAAALLARDTAALADLLHPSLRYVHAPGACHDRAALLRFVADGPRFHGVDFTVDQHWPLADDAVLLCGRLHLRLQRGDAPVQDARSWASALWCRAADGTWRLAVFQSTREADT